DRLMTKLRGQRGKVVLKESPSGPCLGLANPPYLFLFCDAFPVAHELGNAFRVFLDHRGRSGGFRKLDGDGRKLAGIDVSGASLDEPAGKVDVLRRDVDA